MTTKSISRRKFISYSIIGTGSIALTGLGVWRVSEDYQIVVSILKRRLNQLQIDNNVYLIFAKEYVELKQQYRKKLKILSTISRTYEIVSPYDLLEMGHPLRRLEDNIVSIFLLSTDFFDHQEKQDRQLNYLGFYNPYKQPCRKLFL